MQRLNRITIENFKSIGGTPVTLEFPENCPVVLLGENNAGKSNIIKAIELIFGEYHPKYKKLDNFDHFNRDENNQIVITAEVAQFINRLGKNSNFTCGGFEFRSSKSKDHDFVAIQSEDGVENQYVSNNLREELLCVIVNAEQNLNYQLSYSSKFTLLSKITRSFHDRLVENEERVEKLKGIFKVIQETFSEVDEFSNFNLSMSSLAGEMLSNMSHALKFDFSAYDPSNYFKTLRVHPTEDGQTRAFEEIGTGQQQILALAFAHAYAKCFSNQGLLFVLDEPESHLHPLAQKWLAKKMFTMAKDGLQLIVTTHSPHFINLEFLEGINVVSKGEQTYAQHISVHELVEFCHNTGAPRAEEHSILSFYAAHAKPHILNGFFAKKVILVEGETEELSLPIYLEHVGLDTLKECIAIIGVGGKGNLAKWWRLFRSFEIPTFICFDNDSKDDENGIKRADALRAIGLHNHKEITDLLTSNSWNLGEEYCVFGKDFEDTMRQSLPKYTKIEAEENVRLGNSKPIVARAVAERICEESNVENEVDFWAPFRELSNKILDLH